MKLDNTRRESMFNQAKAIHFSLGNVFQNEYELTSGMLDTEFDSIRSLEDELFMYKKRLTEIKEEKRS